MGFTVKLALSEGCKNSANESMTYRHTGTAQIRGEEIGHSSLQWPNGAVSIDNCKFTPLHKSNYH